MKSERSKTWDYNTIKFALADYGKAFEKARAHFFTDASTPSGILLGSASGISQIQDVS